jgi:hypothetical protein
MLFKLKRKIMNAKKINPDAFCWNSKMIADHESLWSLLHKFAALNSTTAQNIKRMFASGIFKNMSFSDGWRWKNRADLRDFGALEPLTLARVFHMSPLVLKGSVGSIYLKSDELRTMASDELRYCVFCLKLGFHSIIYQLSFVKECPIHENSPFRVGCENCDARIPYLLTAKAFKYPYSCSNCRQSFTHTLDDPRNETSITGKEKSLVDLHNWLLKRKELSLVDRPIFQNEWSEPGKKKSKTESVFINLFPYWSDVIDPHLKSKKSRAKHSSLTNTKYSYMNYKASKAQIPTTDSASLERDLYLIYKAIRRALIKTRLRNHVSCIEKYGRSLFWDKHTITYKGKICIETNAFILWRMFIEQLDHPILLFKKFRPSPKFNYDRAPVRWARPDSKMPDVVIKKLFSLECYAAFIECQKLSKIFFENGAYSLNSRFVKGNEINHWTVEQSEHVTKVHWWKRMHVITDSNISTHCILKGKSQDTNSALERVRR